jgi:hypothetical protein
MSEPATEQEPEAAAPSTGIPTMPAPEPESAKPEPEDEAFDKDRAMATITKQREEVKALKARAKEAEDKAAKFDQLEAEKLSEQEKLAKRAEEAEQKVAQAQQKLRQANLIAELSKPEHGIVNAGAAAKLIEGVEYGDDDRPGNLTDLLPDFLEANQYLRGEVKQPPPAKVDGGAGRTEGPRPPLTADELQAANSYGMTPEHYAALKDVENVDDYVRLQAQERQAAEQ